MHSKRGEKSEVKNSVQKIVNSCFKKLSDNSGRKGLAYLIAGAMLVTCFGLSTCGKEEYQTSKPKTEATQEYKGKIAFFAETEVEETDEGVAALREVFTMNPDGSGKKNLGIGTDPAWSPNGKMIAFGGADGDLYKINSDGSKKENLTNDIFDDYHSSPAWSPDGKKIVYVSDLGLEEAADDCWISIVDVEKKTKRRLACGTHPSWCPDGTKIAFASDRGLYVINPDGTNQKRLIDIGICFYCLSLACSPDGNRIAYTSRLDSEFDEIHVVNVDGTNHKRLTYAYDDDDNPDWSPDGKKIAFTSKRDSNSEIYVMNLDGSAQRNLTNSPGSDSYPIWSPDGKKIAFLSYRDGNTEIYTMNADGSDQRRLTRSEYDEYSARWQPIPK